MLMAAVEYDRVDLLQYLVRTVGANLSAMVPIKLPNCPYSTMPRTALHEAAEQGNKVATRKLIELGADVNAIDGAGLSPLHYAVGLAKYEREVGCADEDWDADEEPEYDVYSTAVLRLLLKHGAEIEVEEPHQGQTPLLWASIDGNTEAIRLLLHHGADISACDEDACTALHLAAGSGNQDAVELLVQKGADIFAIDYHARTPIDLSASDLVWEILRKAGALTGPELGHELDRL